MGGDKFTNPTNSYMQEEHDKIVASGKRKQVCRFCGLLRWYEAATMSAAGEDAMCDSCCLNGAPGRARQGTEGNTGLSQRQRWKRR